MALILEDVLIRKKHESLPEGSSGYCVRLPSVFLFMLSDGAEVKGELKQGSLKKDIKLILEKETCDDFLHIAAEDWNANLTVGRADLKLIDAIQKGKRTLIFENRDVITSPAQACRITSKR